MSEITSVAPALSIDRAVVQIGDTTILDEVSLDIEPGTIAVVVGANGAGKTTMLDVICGTVAETSGSVSFDGNATQPVARRARIGRVFQGSPMPETLTVTEVASLAVKGRDEAEALLRRFGLAPHAMTFVGELSTGMRRILDLAIATAGRPALLLLDEPASGLAQSEIDHLAAVVRGYRDETGIAIVVVEHDASLVRAIADEVVVLEAGRVIARGSVDEVLAASHAESRPRINAPEGERFHDALARIETVAAPAAGLPTRSLSKWSLMRLGLREMSAGMASVLILGVLSRVLKTDLKVSLGVVAAILASYNLAAPVAVWIGHRSDTKPLFGRRRVSYIVAGALVTGACVAAAPHVATRLAGGITFGSVIACVALFVAMGVGMYGSGTVFNALISDITTVRERGHAASVIYLELMAGVLAGVALTGALVDNTKHDLGTLFGVSGVLVVALSIIAVWGHDTVKTPPAPARGTREAPTFRDAVREVARMRQARIFFLFMVASTLFLFLQQAILTPFAGDVLHLSIRGSANFKAMLTIGTIAGMIVAGRPVAEQWGFLRVAVVGLIGSVAAFVALGLAAGAGAAAPAWLATLLLGLTSGLFNVASLALMFSMADRRRAALFMGAWTLAHALADGGATAGGGVVYEIASRVLHSVPGGYAAVFWIEAIGLLLCLPLLRRVDLSRFAQEAEQGAAAAMEALASEGSLLLEPLPVTDGGSEGNGAKSSTKKGARGSRA